MKVILEPGPAGTGPSPIHLHRGQPTPWAEGCFFRVEHDAAESILVNAQPGFGYATSATVWEAAGSVLLIAEGATYFVNPTVPNAWKYLSDTGTACVLSPAGTIALISTYDEVVAINIRGEEQWRRVVAIDGVLIHDVVDGVVHGEACMDPPDDWVRFKLRLEDGAVVE